MMKPSFVTEHFEILLVKNQLKKIRFYGVRHGSIDFDKFCALDKILVLSLTVPNCREETRAGQLSAGRAAGATG